MEKFVKFRDQVFVFDCLRKYRDVDNSFLQVIPVKSVREVQQREKNLELIMG